MNFVENVLARLSSIEVCGYHAGSEAATEPTALAALALVAHDHYRAAQPHLDWLLARQAVDGSVGVDAVQPAPGWTTAWSVVAWQATQQSPIAASRFATAIDRALNWIFQIQGSIIEHVEELGHDTTIKGWPWVQGTHAWVEPTAMNLLALRHAGHGSHARAREAVRLLHDRLLPSGGCNYGNTVVFGQELRPHLQPTGMCLLALAGVPDKKGLVEKAVEFATRELTPRTTCESLSYALLGVAAHGRPPEWADRWLAATAERTLVRDPAAYKLALLALAAQGETCPLIPRLQPATT